MFKKFFSALRIWWNSSRNEMVRCAAKLNCFDIVSFNSNPTYNELYFIYSSDDTEMSLVRLADYSRNKDGKYYYDADLDKQILYSYADCKRYLHKVLGQSLKTEEIMTHLSARELVSYAVRMSRVANFNYPIFCWFIDKRDDHIMFIVDKFEREDGDLLLVYDMTIAFGTGIHHNLPYAHYVKYKDIKDKVCLKTTDVPDLHMMLTRPWRREVLSDITGHIFSTLAASESKYDKYSVVAKYVTLCNNLNACDSSMQDNTLQKETTK